MQDFLQALDSKCVINRGAFFAVLQEPEKCTLFCKCLIMNVLKNVLQFQSTYIGDSESHHRLEYQFCRSLEENVGEDSVLVSKRY